MKLPRKVANSTYKERAKYLVDIGELEELCSVLMIAVGRHFFLLFNIVHMLEKANEHTVPALEELYKETVFDPDLIKLWWNPQSDITVLDYTIAHMYQGTERPAFQHWAWRAEVPYTITPNFRISSPYFNGERPNGLKFPTESKQCDLHEEGCNKLGIACCCGLGNIDIAALLNHFCRVHGLQTAKLTWTSYRHCFNYWDLLCSALSTDRLWPIMDHMKRRAEASRLGQDRFYQSLGKPGMEKDDDAMAYDIGDVAGQNLIFEQLFASDDKRFIDGVLSAYNYGRGTPPESIKPARRLGQQRAGECEGLPLFFDNPKSFTDEPFARSKVSDHFTTSWGWTSK